MNTKILFADLDGTLLNKQKQITPLTYQTLKEWTNKGHKLVLCSGRALDSVINVRETLGLGEFSNMYLIGYNGGEIYDCTTKTLLNRVSLSYEAAKKCFEIAKKVGCKYHFCHMSVKESFDAIRKAQKEGYTNITCEVAPHHLVLNETMIKDANWKMNPPLRSRINQLATIEALLDGTACMVASDHAPHTELEKSREYDLCPNGIIGIETMIPIIYTNFVKTGLISLSRFLDLLVYNPIKVFNLPKRDLNVGSIADIAVIDIENEHTYTKEEILSMGKNTPFIGCSYYGFTRYTLVNGKIVYKK